ncbi:MAG: hypothetical protein AAF196_04620 [Planctomycetota bacterium]
MATRTLTVLFLSALGFGCVSHNSDLEFAAQKELILEEYRELEAQKASLWREGFNRRRYEFEDIGTIEVLRWHLAGSPGREWIEAQIRYVNTTEVPMSEAFVQLDVLDSGMDVRGSSAVRWINPMGFAFFPGHSYVGYLKVPTNGAHEDPEGWSWVVDADAIIEEEAGPPPVLINHDLEDGRAQRAQQATLRRMPIRRGSASTRRYNGARGFAQGQVFPTSGQDFPIRFSAGRDGVHTPGVTR